MTGRGRGLHTQRVHTQVSEPSQRRQAGGPARADDHEQILARYLALLDDAQSPLVHAGPALIDQLTSQLYSIVDAVYKRFDAPGAGDGSGDEGTAPADGAGAGSLSEDIGRRRAGSRTHPSHSLEAAALIFRATMPSLTERLREAGDPEPATAAAYALNEEIMSRMSVAAVGYVEYLLTRTHTSQKDERRRLSRELHDVAAPAVAVALQNLELSEIYAQDDPVAAQAKRDAARQALLDALSTIRSLSAESRESVQRDGLVAAVQRDLDAVPTDICTALRVDGDPDTLSPYYADDLFLMIREAVRNAAEHADPRRILVRIVANDSGIEARVADDGAGFDVHRALLAGARHVGLDSMHERAALIGAQLVIVSQRHGDAEPSTVVDGLPDSGKLKGLTMRAFAPSPTDVPASSSGTTVVIRMTTPHLPATPPDTLATSRRR